MEAGGINARSLGEEAGELRLEATETAWRLRWIRAGVALQVLLKSTDTTPSTLPLHCTRIGFGRPMLGISDLLWAARPSRPNG